MKKESNLKRFSLVILFLGIMILVSGFVNAKIMTTKDQYTSVDSISVKSDQNPLCFAAEGDVHLYVVEKDDFSDGDKLDDVRGDFTEFPNSMETEKVWENPTVGEYNVIVDCDTNGKYDVGEPIDDGFNVVFKRGSGEIVEGEKNPGDFSWYYDSEEIELDVMMMQLKLSASFEDIAFNNITVEFDFPGSNKIEKLDVYVDKNDNGNLDDGDDVIGWVEPGTLREGFFFLDYTLKAGSDKDLFFVYKMKEDSDEGEYKLKVVSIYGNGVVSDKLIRFFGSPISSSVMTVLPEKTCLGETSLEFTPNPAVENSKVVAKISSLSGCDGEKVLLKKDPCYMFNKPNIGSCVVLNGECEVNLAALEGKYFACIHKNNDQDFGDFGEFATQDLTLEVLEVEGDEEDTMQDLGDNSDDENTITGNVVNEGVQGLSDELAVDFGANSSFMVLLEVTLLLILFVLILILFKLKGPTEHSEEEIEVDLDSKEEINEEDK
jgi:hypothetical protein